MVQWEDQFAGLPFPIYRSQNLEITCLFRTKEVP